jgi:hypothetical protein
MTKAIKSKGRRPNDREAERAKFWSQRARAFRKGNKEYPRLRGHWSSITDTYTLQGSEDARDHFLVLARIASEARRTPKDLEPWKLWLAEIISLKVNCRENPHTHVYPVEYLKDPAHKLHTPFEVLPVGEGCRQTGSDNRVFEGKTVTIHRLFQASALLCDLLESETRRGHRVRTLKATSEEMGGKQNVQKAGAREQWLSTSLAGKYSYVDLANTKKVSYNTIQKYRTGVTTSQTLRVRRGIADALNELGIKCEFSEVPE